MRPAARVAAGPLLLVSAAAVGACWQVTRPSLPTPPPEPAPQTAVASAPPPQTSASAEIDESPTAEAYAQPPPLSAGPQVNISDIVGTTPAAAGAMLAPALEPIGRCQTKTKGKLIVQVIAEKDRAHLRVTDAGQLGAETNHCVLEALSMMDVDQAMSGADSSTDRPVHVESQIVITW